MIYYCSCSKHLHCFLKNVFQRKFITQIQNCITIQIVTSYGPEAPISIQGEERKRIFVTLEYWNMYSPEEVRSISCPAISSSTYLSFHAITSSCLLMPFIALVSDQKCTLVVNLLAL